MLCQEEILNTDSVILIFELAQVEDRRYGDDYDIVDNGDGPAAI
jgi:hypothetical protein